MKKVISLVLATFLCAAVFVGCGNNSLSEVEKAGDVITYLEEQGFPIVYKIQYTRENDPNGSGDHGYISKANFSDSTIEDTYDIEQPESGTVELFETAEKAEQRAKDLKELQSANSLAYIILKDKILLRINTYANEEIVEKYAKAIGAEIYSKPSEVHKMLKAVPIENGLFAVSPNDFTKIINQYIQDDEALIRNMSKTTEENKVFYTYNIDRYSKIRFITDETQINTQAILLESNYRSDPNNGFNAGSYFSYIMLACDKKMTSDLGKQIAYDLNMFDTTKKGTYLSVHNGVTYSCTIDRNKITVLIQPESANQSDAVSDTIK